MNPSDFYLVPMSQLGEREFAEHPVWSELYDYEERAEIVSWGVDADWLDRHMKDNDIGNDHWAYPVLRPQPLPERMRIYIAAAFTTPSGLQLRGFVVNPDAYCISIFSAGEQFTISRHPDIADLTCCVVDTLCLVLRVPSEAVFPIRYETQFRDHDNNLIRGTFEIPNRGVPPRRVIK